MNLIKFKATKNDEGRTIYKYLIKKFDNVPKSRIEKLFRLKDIKINDLRINNKSIELYEGDLVEIYGIENFSDSQVVKTSITFNVVYEDDNILVINKPISISMHGYKDSLDNQVLTYLKYVPKDSFKPASIGRLDRSTSGLIIYAKNYSTLVQLNDKNAYFEKIYILKSDFPWEKKEVTFYARKNFKTFKYELFWEKPGLKMQTIFFKIGNKKFAQILTGKKHQIRVTLSKLGFPIYGDTKYGGKHDKRVYLHSYRIILKKLENELEYLNDVQFNCEPKW